MCLGDRHPPCQDPTTNTVLPPPVVIATLIDDQRLDTCYLLRDRKQGNTLIVFAKCGTIVFLPISSMMKEDAI